MPSSPPAANDIQLIKMQLDRVEAKTDHLITVVETRKALTEGFDDRIVKLDTLERSLATTALKLAGSRVLANFGGAIAGVAAGVCAAWYFLSSVASAH